MSSLKDRLAALSQSYKEAPANIGGDLPPGSYQFTVAKAVLNEAKSGSKRLQISWDFVVISGEHKGRHHFDHQGLDNEESLPYVKGRLAQLGAPCDDIANLEDSLGKVIGAKFNGQLVQNKKNAEFLNLYIRGPINEADEEATRKVAKMIEEDDGDDDDVISPPQSAKKPEIADDDDELEIADEDEDEEDDDNDDPEDFLKDL